MLGLKGSCSQEAEVEVNHVIDAVIVFNNQPDLPTEQKWYIGIGSIRKLSSRGDNVIKRVLAQRHDEVQQHNDFHGLVKWHDARGKEALSIDQVIHLDSPSGDILEDN